MRGRGTSTASRPRNSRGRTPGTSCHRSTDAGAAAPPVRRPSRAIGLPPPAAAAGRHRHADQDDHGQRRRDPESGGHVVRRPGDRTHRAEGHEELRADERRVSRLLGKGSARARQLPGLAARDVRPRDHVRRLLVHRDDAGADVVGEGVELGHGEAAERGHLRQCIARIGQPIDRTGQQIDVCREAVESCYNRR
jgi:hypothetical protein